MTNNNNITNNITTTAKTSQQQHHYIATTTSQEQQQQQKQQQQIEHKNFSEMRKFTKHLEVKLLILEKKCSSIRTKRHFSFHQRNPTTASHNAATQTERSLTQN